VTALVLVLSFHEVFPRAFDHHKWSDYIACSNGMFQQPDLLAGNFAGNFVPMFQRSGCAFKQAKKA
jgi:hypothetical protein